MFTSEIEHILKLNAFVSGFVSYECVNASPESDFFAIVSINRHVAMAVRSR